MKTIILTKKMMSYIDIFYAAYLHKVFIKTKQGEIEIPTTSIRWVNHQSAVVSFILNGKEYHIQGYVAPAYELIYDI